jgi:uncharacterized 2Fe-2S/4Fe-4S cluster protein (DUF4445 family)
MQSPQSQYGLAVDLGTTHISLSLWDLKHGHRLASRTGVNQQCHYGTDVVTRLIVAGESPGNAQRLSRMALDAVCEGLLDVCSRNGFDLREVTHVTIVGNSPMLMLLTEAYPRILLQPQFWTSPIECKPDNPQTWVDVLGIHPGATVEVIPPLAGFVGSDLLAGVLATRLTDHRSGLLIDFGTNSEMALWDGHTLWVTSAAGGPAFEGCGMQCGLPAETGAIYHVDRKEDSTELHLEVIGGGEARGLCGSGLVDLIACLRNTGDLTAIGKLAIPYRKDGFVVQEKGLPIRLTGKDVDVFQRGKAAIGAGIKTLLSKAQMRLEKLSRICVCGAFGQHLNARNARLIGLLPDTPPEKVELCGNTALAGCERLLLSPTKESDLASLRKRAAIINLSQSPDFETLFLESLYLQPLSTQPFAAGLTEMTTELRTKYA